MLLSASAPTVLPASAWGNSDLWDREYEVFRSIPSSHRLRPSRAFQKMEELLDVRPGRRVLDAGAGTGRHALYLAAKGCKVHAVDSSASACSILSSRLEARKELKQFVRVEHASLGPCDTPEDEFDLIIDSYVSCHFLSDEQRLQYLETLVSRLSPNGVLYTACMGSGDEFYRRFRSEPSHASTDPYNGITKLLQDENSFRASLDLLSPSTAGLTERFLDIAAGYNYRREVVAGVIRRPA